MNVARDSNLVKVEEKLDVDGEKDTSALVDRDSETELIVLVVGEDDFDEDG